MSKIKLSCVSTVLFVLIGGIAFANEGHATGGEHSAGLTDATLKTIIYQAINVGAIVLAMVYFLRATVKQYFVTKKAVYTAAAEKSQIARKAAEDEHLEIKIQLSKLESTADESISRAKAEAVEMKTQLLSEAKAISKRIREEATITAQLEIEKAKNHLREELIKESFLMAEKQMTSKVSSDDHARLQGEFINNIQAAQR